MDLTLEVLLKVSVEKLIAAFVNNIVSRLNMDDLLENVPSKEASLNAAFSGREMID